MLCKVYFAHAAVRWLVQRSGGSIHLDGFAELLLGQGRWHFSAGLLKSRTDLEPSAAESALAQEARQNMISLALSHAPNVGSLAIVPVSSKPSGSDQLNVR